MGLILLGSVAIDLIDIRIILFRRVNGSNRANVVLHYCWPLWRLWWIWSLFGLFNLLLRLLRSFWLGLDFSRLGDKFIMLRLPLFLFLSQLIRRFHPKFAILNSERLTYFDSFSVLFTSLEISGSILILFSDY